MLYKKLNLPINLPITNYEEFNENKSIEDVVNKIIKSSKIGEKSSISLFKNFFENSLSEIINQRAQGTYIHNSFELLGITY